MYLTRAALTFCVPEENSLREAGQAFARKQPFSAREAVERDAVLMLYAHGGGSVLVSMLACSGLAFITRKQLPAQPLAAWWLSMLLVLLLRGVDVLHFHQIRIGWMRPGATEVRNFAVGVIVTGVLWAIFPVAFLQELDQGQRAYAAIILCGMTGGSATVLAPSKSLSAVFSALLVLPASLLFLSFAGPENKFFGLLGCAYFLVMYASSRITHRATMSAVELSRANEALLGEMGRERRRAEAANMGLKAAEAALREANGSLEFRIRDRTAALQQEIREKERFARELAHLASTDSLTGLCNRTSLGKRLSTALAEADERGQSLAVLFLDLDKFKEVNDVMGHLAGDWVLQAVAQRLQDHLPAQVELARWGGDEFVVALAGPTNAELAIELAGDLSRRLCEPIAIDSCMVRVDVTIGIALFPEHGRNEEDLIRAADMAMYASKQEKRSRIRVFDPALSQRVTERLRMERALRQAIETGELEVHFQPILRTPSGECEALEALARWHDPERGYVAPGEFIPMAEQSGDIAALGRAVLKRACAEAAAWPAERGIAVSVNVSAVQLESGGLLEEIVGILEETGLAAPRLQLELTESVFAGDRRGIIPTLKNLRGTGVKIVLDDFGTGFSCLADLRRLPIDRLKIDKSFVESMEADSEAIVKAIVVTAETFGLGVVAEGVETREQARKLADLGVEYLQGFLFSPVLPAHAAREWVREWKPEGGLTFSASSGR